MRKIRLFFILIICVSCNKTNNENKNSSIINDTLQSDFVIKDDLFYDNNSSFSTEIIEINYQNYKVLFDILIKLPENSMNSWGWNKIDRQNYVKQIENKGEIKTPTKFFSQVNYITPNSINLQIVDGNWSLSIYKIREDNYIVITNDVVGDSNDLRVFRFLNGDLVSLNKDETSISGYKDKLFVDKTNKACYETFEEEYIDRGFVFDFSQLDKIIINNSMLSETELFIDCFIGNEMVLKFNQNDEYFEIIDIFWKSR